MFPSLMHPHEGMVGQQDVQGGSNHNHNKGDPCLVLTADPKPRLRWTQDLHERFVDAVTQLGGASSKYLFLNSLKCLVGPAFGVVYLQLPFLGTNPFGGSKVLKK